MIPNKSGRLLVTAIEAEGGRVRGGVVGGWVGSWGVGEWGGWGGWGGGALASINNR